jgi:hypothetical protein
VAVAEIVQGYICGAFWGLGFHGNARAGANPPKADSGALLFKGGGGGGAGVVQRGEE